MVQKTLQLAAKLPDYKAFKVKEHDTFGYIITPDDNILVVNKGDFGGIRITFEYIPSRKNGSGCACNDNDIYKCDADILKILEQSGYEFAKELGAKLYTNSEQWLNKCYWKDQLIQLEQ